MSQGDAAFLVKNTLLNEILDDLEHDAIEAALDARSSDHEKRLHATMEANAIRSLRGKLQAIADGPTKPRAKTPVA